MNTLPPPRAKVDAEFILRVLVDAHRQQCQFDPEADSSVELSFSTSVAEWRDACDLIPWQPLGRALMGYWEIEASDDEWRTVLEPPGQRTLLDVCRFLADRAMLPVLQPRGYLGAKCTVAAAFVGIRSMLAAAGHDVTHVKPRSMLAPHLNKAWELFLTFGGRTAPGRLPLVRIESPGYERCVWLAIFCWMGCFAAAAMQLWWLPADVHSWYRLRLARKLDLCQNGSTSCHPR